MNASLRKFSALTVLTFSIPLLAEGPVYNFHFHNYTKDKKEGAKVEGTNPVQQAMEKVSEVEEQKEDEELEEESIVEKQAVSAPIEKSSAPSAPVSTVVLDEKDDNPEHPYKFRMTYDQPREKNLDEIDFETFTVGTSIHTKETISVELLSPLSKNLYFGAGVERMEFDLALNENGPDEVSRYAISNNSPDGITRIEKLNVFGPKFSLEVNAAIGSQLNFIAGLTTSYFYKSMNAPQLTTREAVTILRNRAYLGLGVNFGNTTTNIGYYTGRDNIKGFGTKFKQNNQGVTVGLSFNI